MFQQVKLRLASILYRYAFPVYRAMYFRFKEKKDGGQLLLLRRLVQPGSVVVDIGANIGFYTKFLSGCVGIQGHVYGFEPDRTNFRHLEKELDAAGNVTLQQNAVASSFGELFLYTSPLLNVDHRTYQPERYSSKYSVNKISLDEFFEGKHKPDFIKMDIQGFEIEALKGMKKILNSQRHIIILSELWPYGLMRAGSSSLEVFDFLRNMDFLVYGAGGGQLHLLKREDVEALGTDYFTDLNIFASRKELIN